MAHAVSATVFANKADVEAALVDFCADAEVAAATHGTIGSWDVSAVKYMSRLILLAPCKATFNADISGWDTSSVTNMFSMFNGATAFNQPLSWDTSRVANMGSMFYKAEAFNQPLSWNISSLTINTAMGYMFMGNYALSDANMVLTRCAWAGNTVFDDTYHPNMFEVSEAEWSGLGACPTVFATKEEVASALDEFCADAAAAEETHGAIGSWDVSAVTDMRGLMEDYVVPLCLATFNADISGWDTSSVTTMQSMFAKAAAFNQPLRWNTSSVTSMMGTFYDAGAFNQPLRWDTSSVTDMQFMFYEAEAFNQPLSFDTSQVTTMGEMFRKATAFNQPLSWDISTNAPAQRNDMFNEMFGAAGDAYALSDANKVLTSCAWAGNTAFDDT